MAGELDPLWLPRKLLQMADDAGMPEPYWRTDQVLREAREKLGVPDDGRLTHAHLWGRVSVPAEQQA